MKRNIIFFLIIIISFNIPLIYSANEEGYGEGNENLGQFVDSFENLNNVSVKYQVERNATLNAMELNHSGIFYYANEIFTTYNEVDSGNDLTVHDYNVTITTIRRDAIDWISYDFGIDYFDEILHNFTFKVTDVEAGDVSNRLSYGMWSISAVEGTYMDMYEGGNCIMVLINQITTYDDQYRLNVIWYDCGILQDQVFGNVRTVDIELYLSVEYTDDDVFVRVYTDEAHTALDETISILNKVDQQYRWINVAYSIDSTGDGEDWASGYVKNLWIGNYIGGYYLDGYFITEDYLNYTMGNSLVLLTNASIPSGTTLTVQFSNDNSTWLDNEGNVGSTTIGKGFYSIDLRDLNYTDIYSMFNFSSNLISTPRLYQSRLVSTNGTTLNGFEIVYIYPNQAIIMLIFLLSIVFILLYGVLRRK